MSQVVQIYDAYTATLSGAVQSAIVDGWSGSGFADYINASTDYVEFNISVPSAGTYSIFFRYANGSSNRPLELKVNGSVADSSLDFPTVITTNWYQWAYTAITDVTLNAGGNTVRLTAIGSSGANIDSLFVVSGSSATGILGKYTFGNGTPSNVDSDVTLSTISNTQSLTEFDLNYTGGYPLDPVFRVGGNAEGGDTQANAIINATYFDLTVTPAAGKSIDLTFLEFKAAKQGAYNAGCAVAFSTDSYSTIRFSRTVLSTQRTSWTSYGTDLSGIAELQDLTSAVTVRVYVFNSTGDNGDNFDDITVFGSVVNALKDIDGQSDVSIGCSASTIDRVRGVSGQSNTTITTTGNIVSTRGVSGQSDVTFVVTGDLTTSSQIYTRGEYAVLPSDDANLENSFGVSDYTDVESDNDVRVGQTAVGGKYSVFLFKNKGTAENPLTITWNGQTNQAPNVSVAKLQIYNRVSLQWNDVDTDDATGADIDFTLTSTLSTNLDEYYDANYWVSCRVYQESVFV